MILFINVYLCLCWSKIADVWSIGVILYVLLAGYLPFDENTMAALFQKIKNADYEFPEWFSAEARDLISKILVPDPHKRPKITELKNHPWMMKEDSGPSPMPNINHATKYGAPETVKPVNQEPTTPSTKPAVVEQPAAAAPAPVAATPAPAPVVEEKKPAPVVEEKKPVVEEKKAAAEAPKPAAAPAAAAPAKAAEVQKPAATQPPAQRPVQQAEEVGPAGFCCFGAPKPPPKNRA